MFASMKGHLPVVRKLLIKGARVLMGASESGHLKLVQMLLSKGADVNTQSMMFEETALMLASKNGHFKVVEALLAKEANVNATNIFGRTALDQPRNMKTLERYC